MQCNYWNTEILSTVALKPIIEASGHEGSDYRIKGGLNSIDGVCLLSSAGDTDSVVDKLSSS